MTRLGLLDSLLFLTGDRHLQMIPDYTSPPLPIALEATPEAFRSDEVIDEARAADAAGNCTVEGNRCHIPFPVSSDMFLEPSKVGMIFYTGGLVDSRGYAPISALVAERYGIPSVIPIFSNDIAFVFGQCDSGRLDMAKAEFPDVEKWVLAGHSFGGISAVTDQWQRMESDDESAAGLVMMAADIQQGLCGSIDYSNSSVPMALLTGSLDLIINTTRWEENLIYSSPETFVMDIYGASHASFGAYDASERFEVLGQTDGEPLIPSSVAWDLTAAAIAHVAVRTGVPLPQKMDSSSSNTATQSPIVEDESAENIGTDPDSVNCAGLGTSAGNIMVATRSLFSSAALAALTWTAF